MNLIRFKRATLLISIFGFTVSLFFCGYALGLFQMEQLKETEKLSRGEMSILRFSSYIPYYEDVSSRLCITAICFLLFGLISRFTKEIFFRIVSFLPLAALLLQAFILSRTASLLIESPKMDEQLFYSKMIFYYLSFFVIALAVLLILLQFFLILKEKSVKDSNVLIEKVQEKILGKQENEQ